MVRIARFNNRQLKLCCFRYGPMPRISKAGYCFLPTSYDIQQYFIRHLGQWNKHFYVIHNAKVLVHDIHRPRMVAKHKVNWRFFCNLEQRLLVYKSNASIITGV